MKYSTKTKRLVSWAIGGLASCFVAMSTMGQAVVTQSTAIAINDLSKASPYPSTNQVQNTLGTIEKVTVTLNSVTHGYPDDIDMVLEGPDGTKVTLMSDAGGQFDLSSTTFTLDSTAGTALPDEAVIDYQGKKYIFVTTEEPKHKGVYHFAMVEVEAGLSELGYTEITPPKDFDLNKSNVVIKGAYALLSKMKNTEEEE